MSIANIPRFLLPRSTAPKQSAHLNTFHVRPSKPPPSLSTPRHASSEPSTSKPRVLEKPAKFNPPSHPARLNRAPPRQYPGPPLSAPEKEAQKTKQYPHMMPPDGSFMHWFLTNRSIHLYITLTTLFSLALFTFITNFYRTSPFAHLLPAGNTFLSHPLDFVGRYVEVYKLHTAHISAETAERRRKKVEDVQKRSEYRKAHGMDKEEGLGGWTAREKGEEMGPALRVEGQRVGADGAMGTTVRVDEGETVYKDWEGRKKPVKKWLGIW